MHKLEQMIFLLCSDAFFENDQSLAMNKAFCEKMALNDTI